MSWLYSAPIPLLVAVLVVALLAALEFGHRLAQVAPIEEREISTIAASILALVGLLLAFSFAMASDRLALRRAAAVEEVNSIGTLWLRTSLLPEPTQSEMQRLLRRYVDVHLEHRRAGIDEATTRSLEAEGARIQDELWRLQADDARRDPEAARLRLVMPALNAMLDDTATVLAARENRLPDAIFLYLFLLSVIGAVVVAYRPPGEKRKVVPWTMFTLILAGVLLILLDVDRPRRGLIQTDVAPYLRLQKIMASKPP